MEDIKKIKQCALFEVKNYDNTQLRQLLKEIKGIGNAEKPSTVKQSETMKQLFKLEETGYNHWIDKYYNISKAIEVEILYRIAQDAF